MAYPKRRPPCQGCESQNLRRMSGCWANDGTVPVAYYKCLDCGLTGLSGEFWLPEGTSMTSLDFDRRLVNRILKRKARGVMHRTQDVRHGMRLSSDTLVADITIVPGKVQRGLAKRLTRLRVKRSAA
jgi:hypothetical protein